MLSWILYFRLSDMATYPQGVSQAGVSSEGRTPFFKEYWTESMSFLPAIVWRLLSVPCYMSLSKEAACFMKAIERENMLARTHSLSKPNHRSDILLLFLYSLDSKQVTKSCLHSKGRIPGRGLPGATIEAAYPHIPRILSSFFPGP